MPLSAQDVAEITRLLEQSQFDELHLEHEGLKLTLRRRGAAGDPAPAPLAPAAPRTSAAPGSPRGAPVSAPVPAAAPAAAPHGAPAPGTVPAPFLGTFYRAPKPGAAPYIEVGAEVREDSIIGIIEVMKLMNTVRAGVQGRVAEIFVADGQLVEYGQPLLRVAPAA